MRAIKLELPEMLRRSVDAPHEQTRTGRKPQNLNGIAPLTLALFFALALAGLSLLPRVRANYSLAASFWIASSGLLLSILILRSRVTRAGRILVWEFAPKNVHYVQLAMQSCIYFYWGRYWREVYNYAPLIAAQIVFAYTLDMLICWARRDKWVFGFGPFPIVLSTNLFLWFKDDWFFLQFLMVATGVLGKEFLKWKREGRLTHIFNPSAFALFVFSVGLISTQRTDISWGQTIALTISSPPNMYLEIFLLGLVVQALFSVTLVTLSAAATLYALNIAYTHWTGGYHFIDSNIPVLVFLGLHLLVTDPATSPRTAPGKVMFGGLYGLGVFAMFGFLGWIGAPRFYEKILCVPALNLSVRELDRVGGALAARFALLKSASVWSPRQANFAHMALWVSLFTAMMLTGFLGRGHPGRDPAFWQRACQEGNWNGCMTWVHTLDGDR